MRNLFNAFVLWLSLFLGLWISWITQAQFAWWSGSSSDPYEISSCTELQEVNNHMSSSFVLLNNLDCTSIGNNAMVGWTNNTAVAFEWAFDGDGYSITIAFNASFNRIGLFRFANNASISNLHVNADLTVGNTSSAVGAIAGFANNTTISNSSADIQVDANWHSIGGLVGRARNSSIQNSHSIGSVDGQYNIGGLVGYSDQGITITDSYSQADVSWYSQVWGLLWGPFNGANITNSYAESTINATRYAGGIVGYASGTNILDSVSFDGTITANDHVGGILGWNNNQVTINNASVNGTINGGSESIGWIVWFDKSQTTISQSFVHATVDGDDYIWGIVWGSLGSVTITDSYVLGDVSGNSYVGGLVGRGTNLTATNAYVAWLVSGNSNIGWLNALITNNNTITSSYRDLLSGNNVTTSDGGTGLNTADMKDFSTFDNAGRDIQASSSNLNNGYPFLAWEVNNSDSVWKVFVVSTGSSADFQNNTNNENETTNWENIQEINVNEGGSVGLQNNTNDEDTNGENVFVDQFTTRIIPLRNMTIPQLISNVEEVKETVTIYRESEKNNKATEDMKNKYEEFRSYAKENFLKYRDQKNSWANQIR